MCRRKQKFKPTLEVVIFPWGENRHIEKEPFPSLFVFQFQGLVDLKKREMHERSIIIIHNNHSNTRFEGRSANSL